MMSTLPLHMDGSIPECLNPATPGRSNGWAERTSSAAGRPVGIDRVERLSPQQSGGEIVELVAMVAQQLRDLGVGVCTSRRTSCSISHSIRGEVSLTPGRSGAFPFRAGTEVDRLVGAAPYDRLARWLEPHLTTKDQV